MRRIAAGAVPGWPLHLTTCYVEQEVLGSNKAVLDAMLSGGESGGGASASGAAGLAAAQQRVARLEAEQEELEVVLGDAACASDLQAEAADRLGEVYAELEELEEEERGERGGNSSSSKKARAVAILQGLGFSPAMLGRPVDELSGGWRMRLALGRSLLAKPDILLLDEPTNHLDLAALAYLEERLTKVESGAGSKPVTALVVSHDAHFLDAVCTDVIKFENGKLVYHAGGYSSFREAEEEKYQRHRSTGDAAARKERKAKEFIAKQRGLASSKHRDDNKQKQAAERQRKLGRLGLFAENGHKYKLLAEGRTGGAGSNRAQHIFGSYTSTNGMQSHFVDNQGVAFGEDRQLLNFKFPAAPPLGGSSGDTRGLPLVTLESVSFRYESPDCPGASGVPPLLERVTCGVATGGRAAIVGRNGAGKTTLAKLLAGTLDPVAGACIRHPNLKVAYMAQHQVEQLAAHLEWTPVQYFVRFHRAPSEQEARQFLGGFGLVGPLALQLIGTLSGGQKARLVFATAMYQAPHVLVLDEPTNHLDRDSLGSLAAAVKAFKGAVVVVSHNQEFMAQVATEMWAVEAGHVKVSHLDSKTTFDVAFSDFKAGLGHRKPQEGR